MIARERRRRAGLRGAVPAILAVIAGFLAALAALASPAGAQGGTVDDYQGSWVDRALALQYELAGDAPLRHTPWVGTHNSYNSPAEMGPALSPMDANQRLTMVDQLRIGVRSIELDVHLFPTARDPETGPVAPVVCHALPTHAGCTIEKSLREMLRQLAAWMDQNPGQVLLLYLEDHLDHEAGYDAGAAVIEEEIGSRTFRPPAGGCAELPMELSRDEVRAAGRQVVIMADSCGEGSAWQAVAFDGTNRDQGRPRGFRDFPDCGPDFDRSTYDRTMIRYFEDRTQLTETGSTTGATEPDDGLTPETAARMVRCGVDLIGFDDLLPDDGRLEALVWSWAPGEPRTGGGSCAVQRPDGRWEARPCDQMHRAACRSPSGSWIVPGRRVRASEAPGLCGPRGTVHAVPRIGYQGQLLRDAQRRSGAGPVWLGHRRRAGGWIRFEPRECTPSLRHTHRRWPVRGGRALVVVRLRLPCTGEMLTRRVRISRGLRTVRTRTGRLNRIPVRAGTRYLRAEFIYRGVRRERALRLAGPRH